MVTPGNGVTQCIGGSKPGLPNLLLPRSPGAWNTIVHECDLQLLLERTSQCIYIMSARDYIRFRATDNATALHCMQLLSVVLSAFMDSVLVQAATDRSGVAIGLGGKCSSGLESLTRRCGWGLGGRTTSGAEPPVSGLTELMI